MYATDVFAINVHLYDEYTFLPNIVGRLSVNDKT